MKKEKKFYGSFGGCEGAQWRGRSGGGTRWRGYGGGGAVEGGAVEGAQSDRT